MRPFVVYYTRTGNTKKVAGEIARVLKVEAQDVKDVKAVPDRSMIIVGSGVYKGKAGEEILKFLEDMPSGKCKKAAVFETSRNGKTHVAGEQMRWHLEKKGTKIVDRFVCPGQLFYIMKRGHPTKEDLEKARKFAEGLKKKAAL